jgi:DNA-binding MarR family transcriptional regulator
MITLIRRRRAGGAGPMRHATRDRPNVPTTRPKAPTHPASWPSDDSMSHWVKLAFMTMRRDMESSLRSIGLTLTQWRALAALVHTPGATHSDLVKHLEIEAPSVTSLVNGMERKGWVRQERSETDARVKRLFLTARGRTTVDTARRACAPVERRMEAALPDADRDSLKSLLQAMIRGMQHTGS